MSGNRLVARSTRFVTSLLRAQSASWMHYHNLEHTTTTVAACRLIGKAVGLNGDDLEIVTLAGWFHDTGYTISANRHEEISAAIAMGFLVTEGYPAGKIGKVLACIMATKVPQHPRMLREKVICDADMVSLGKRTFLLSNEHLRQEISGREKRKIGESAWLKRTEMFLSGHRFHTKYGRTVLERGRQRNIAIIQKLGVRGRSTTAIRVSGKKTERKKNESEANHVLRRSE